MQIKTTFLVSAVNKWTRVSLLSIMQTIYLPIYLSIVIPTYLSIWKSIYLSVYLSMYLSREGEENEHRLFDGLRRHLVRAAENCSPL